MICTPCAAAADARAPRDQHCDDPKCMCGHRTERYGTTTEQNTAATPAQPPSGRDDG